MNLRYNDVVFWIMVAIKMAESTRATKRIVGGAECSIKDYPFMVSLRYTNTLKHFCGGSLISVKWILSAAHCMGEFPKTPGLLTAVFGEQRKNGIVNGQFIPARQIFNHPEFLSWTGANDITLVLLKSEVNFTVGNVKTLNLPRNLYMSEDLTVKLDGGKLSVAGWGTRDIINSLRPTIYDSQELKCVNVQYITFEECLKHSSVATRKHICTFSGAGGEDSCLGDSGGPLFRGNIIYGIVSWAKGCGMPGRPTFHTRVDKYLDFIDDTMRSFANKPALLYNILIFVSLYISLIKFDKTSIDL